MRSSFTDSGSVTLTVTVDSSDFDSSTLHFSVRDTGMGITAEAQRRLFQPFEQADASMTRRFGGTGLGLAISAKFVELMDGKMWVESAPGQGSTFHFTIRVALPAESVRHLISPAVITTETNTARLNILVAEDNKINQVVARTMLERIGHSVTMANDGKEAVERWREGEYDVIFMDIQMPELDGYDATRAIRIEELSTEAHVPIIAMTAHAMEKDRDRCLGAGMDDYVTKPISRAAIEQVLATVTRCAVS